MGSSDQRHVVGGAGGVSHLSGLLVGTTDNFVFSRPPLSSVSIFTPGINADLDFPARVPHVSGHCQPANFHSWSCLSARSLVLFSGCVPAEIAAGISWVAALGLCCPPGNKIATARKQFSSPPWGGGGSSSTCVWCCVFCSQVVMTDLRTGLVVGGGDGGERLEGSFVWPRAGFCYQVDNKA